jgi:hypothetical protein
MVHLSDGTFTACTPNSRVNEEDQHDNQKMKIPENTVDTPATTPAEVRGRKTGLAGKKAYKERVQPRLSTVQVPKDNVRNFSFSDD